MLKNSYTKIKIFLEKHERYLSPVAMAIGFVVDNLTLQRIDLWLENLIIISYLLVVTFSIIYLNIYRKYKFENRFLVWLNMILPYVMQVVFGGLFSAFMVFYTRSAAMLVSWPFILILFSLLVGNELFRERYHRLTFHLSILYLAFFAYSVFAMPVLLGRIDIDTWMASGGVSLQLIMIVVLILHRIDREAIRKSKGPILGSVIAIYAGFNILYFANLIPPIPLAMKEGGVYHSVSRSASVYNLEFEKPRWYEFYRETSGVYHWQRGERVYVFSAIFAPSKFKQKIYHRWSYHDRGDWIERDRLGYSISGGRDGGYRGYSFKSALEPGDWRVDVITDRGQVIGRVKFEIVEREGELDLEKEENK